MIKKYCLLLLLIFILSCKSSDGNSSVKKYSYDEIPPINCQDRALFCAVWAERNGYEATIYIGDLNDIRHAQTQIIDFNGEMWWLKFNGFSSPIWLKEIDGWEPEEPLDTMFLKRIYKWALENNFYRE